MTSADFFFAGQQTGFEDYFDRALVRGLDDVPQFAQQIAVVAVLEPADIDDHIDFLGAVVDRHLGFKSFRVGVRRSEGKANHCSDLHSTVLEEMTSLYDPG